MQTLLIVYFVVTGGVTAIAFLWMLVLMLRDKQTYAEVDGLRDALREYKEVSRLRRQEVLAAMKHRALT